MHIREATEADLPAIVDIYNQSIPAGWSTADTNPITVADRVEWFRKFDPTKRPIWVAELDGQVVATAYLSSFYAGRPAYDATAEISQYIATAYHRRGYWPATQAVGDRAVPAVGGDYAPEHALRPQRGHPADQREPGVRAVWALAGDRRRSGPEAWADHLGPENPGRRRRAALPLIDRRSLDGIPAYPEKPVDVYSRR